MKKINESDIVPVAQLDRVSASDAEGCEFEPRRVRHTLLIQRIEIQQS